MAFPADYTHRFRLNVDNAYVPGSSDMTGFVAYIDGTVMPSSFWANVDDGGGDIRASLDSAGTNQLSLQVVTCDTGTEYLFLLVRIPTLYATGDTTLYLWTGNTGDTQPAVDAPFGSESVWAGFVSASVDGGKTDATGQNTVTAAGTPDDVAGPRNGMPASRFLGGGEGYFHAFPSGVENSVFTYVNWAAPTNGQCRTHGGWGNSLSGTVDDQNFIGTWFDNTEALRCLLAGNFYNAEGIAADRVNDVWRVYAARSSGIFARVTVNNGTSFAEGALIDPLVTMNRAAYGISGDSTPFGNQPISVGLTYTTSDDKGDDWISAQYVNWSDPATFFSGGATLEVTGGVAALLVEHYDIVGDNTTVDDVHTAIVAIDTSLYVSSEEVLARASEILRGQGIDVADDYFDSYRVISSEFDTAGDVLAVNGFKLVDFVS